jgi:hypothetical protein
MSNATGPSVVPSGGVADDGREGNFGSRGARLGEAAGRGQRSCNQDALLDAEAHFQAALQAAA